MPQLGATAQSLASEHPSVTALLREAVGRETAEDVMRRKCREMVRAAKARGWSGPPFDPKILASLNGIRVQEVTEDFGSEGRIFPWRNRVVIQFRSGLIPERQRFTICHELAHTCFPDTYERVRCRQTPNLDHGAYRGFEQLCDIGASELLMPYEDFSADLARAPVGLAVTVNLSRCYVASIEATAKRLLDLTTHACAAVFLTDEAFKNFSAVPGRLRVKYFWKSGSFRGFFPPGALVPPDSCVHSAPPHHCTDFSLKPETWLVDGRSATWQVEALRLAPVPSVADYPKVMAFVHGAKI